jgi:hypothetical protein
MNPAFAPQRTEVRHPSSLVIIAVDQERLRLEALRSVVGKRSAQSWPLRVKQRPREPSRRTISR